jgi:1,6-anhydro-N-acetylmuramate kinase
MTGTSIDSIDAALVEITGRGLEMTARFLRGAAAPLGKLAPRLRRLADQEPMTAGDIAALSRDFSLAHLPVLREVLRNDRPDLICIHGQTVFHRPPASWQLLTPTVVAHELKTPMVYDLRAADLAAGGQGAPVTPIADWIFFRDHFDRRTLQPIAVVNLGGFCNLTMLPDPERTMVDEPGEDFVEVTIDLGSGAKSIESGVEEPIFKPLHERDLAREQSMIRGLDVCACNQLLDAIARALLHAPYDAGGSRAMKGNVHADALTDLGGALAAQSGSGRSLGTGDESGGWISRWRARAPADDLAATACEAIAQAVARATRGCSPILLAGGGVHNAALVGAIESCAPGKVERTDARGLPASYREAACFAVLGALCQDRVPITLPRVTHAPAPAPISGSWIFP